MSGWVRLIIRVYRVLLACYPSRFRAEHGEEMQDVLASALAEAQRSGGQRPWGLFWREIRDWPGSVLQQHLRGRRKREMAANGLTEEKPPTRIELLAASIIFLLPFLMVLFGLLAAAGNRRRA